MKVSSQKLTANFDKVVVTFIQDASGVFIGNNYMPDWSSSSKRNLGMGSLGSATVSNNLNVVCDQDFNDMTVNIEKHVVLEGNGIDAPQQESEINFQSINVNAVSYGSAINLGDNKQLAWGSTRKVNYGTGQISGNNQLNKIANVVLDDDVVDATFQRQQKIIENVGNSTKNIRISSQ